MNKELTPLEAFEKILDMAHEPNEYQNFTNACDTPYTKIVKNALEGLEQADKVAVGIYQELNKKLKALEAIKDEFEIDFNDKEQTINFQSVEEPYTHIRFALTRIIKDKERYDLLKEVLS